MYIYIYIYMLIRGNRVFSAATPYVTTGFRQNGKEANNYNWKHNLYMLASLSCASILCEVVLLITNDSIRHAVDIVFVLTPSGGCQCMCLRISRFIKGGYSGNRV